MLEAALVFGLIIFLGLATILAKLPLRMSLRLLGHALWLDIAVTVLVLWIHWGTMTGLMSATVAGLICAILTGVGRHVFGYIKGKIYYPGVVNLTQRLMRGTQKVPLDGCVAG